MPCADRPLYHHVEIIILLLLVAASVLIPRTCKLVTVVDVRLFLVYFRCTITFLRNAAPRCGLSAVFSLIAETI